MDGAEAAGEKARISGTVVHELPRATYRVLLDDRRVVVAHAAGGERKNFVRLRSGDRVSVVLSPHDPTRGRIVERLERQ